MTPKPQSAPEAAREFNNIRHQSGDDPEVRLAAFLAGARWATERAAGLADEGYPSVAAAIREESTE